MTIAFPRLNHWLNRVLNWGTGAGEHLSRPRDPYFTRSHYEPPAPFTGPVAPVVRVRIAVAVNSKGKWYSTGDSDRVSTDDLNGQTALRNLGPGPNTMIHYIEADVPLPRSVTINAHTCT